MRQALLVAVVVAAGLTVGAAVVVLDHHAPPRVVPPSSNGPPAASEPARRGEATAGLPPQDAAPEMSAASPAAPATPEPPPAATAEATPPAKPPASDLPTIDVAPRTAHAVPDVEPPSASVTVVDRNGRTLKELSPSGGLSPTYVPSVGPGGAAAGGSRGSARPLVAPPSSNPRVAMALPGATFDGRANAVGGMTLSVTGRNLRLFGVKPPNPGDRCGLGTGDNRSCGDVARDALAQRLQHYPHVACRVPPGQRGADPAAICTDNSGTDLADFLIGQGYALADTNQSFDYFGAENTARANRRGLWRSR
ncbi:MAG TPA: thermonuclease family protein [Stellaceae bacterium]|jgi:endonuclease YncB( thermonuclease family)|nr:thermonuclease family protein [Stellaceae bacterium]